MSIKWIYIKQNNASHYNSTQKMLAAVIFIIIIA